MQDTFLKRCLLTELICEFPTVAFRMKQHLGRGVSNFDRTRFSNNYEPNCIYKVIKDRLISANYFLPVSSEFLSLRLKSTNVNIKIYRTIISMSLLFLADWGTPDGAIRFRSKRGEVGGHWKDTAQKKN